MPEVIDVRPTDDVQADEAFGAGPPPRWRRVFGLALVAAVALAALYVVVLKPRATEPPSRAGAPASETAAVVDGARAALDAWGRFAVSGDLSQIGATFAPGGPQLERLRAEAPQIEAHPPGTPPYTFTLTNETVLGGASADERIVRGDVVVSRPNEEDQHFQWDLVLHRTESRWLLWTVRQSQSGAPALTPTQGASVSTSPTG